MRAPQVERVVGAVLVAYAVYRAAAALFNVNLLGLLPAACAAILGVWLLRRARRALAVATGSPGRGADVPPP